MIFSLPQATKAQPFSRITTTLSEYFQYAQDAFGTAPTPARGFSARSLKRFFKKSPFIPGAILAVFVILVIGIVIRSLSSSSSGVLSAANEQKVAIVSPKAEQKLNRTFMFSLKDETGKNISSFRYIIEDVQTKDEIIIKAKRYFAVKGKTFLIVNLKIRNDFDKGITINSRDFMRLVVNGSDERLAPDIHNDPVEVQAISTIYTAVAFNIDEVNRSLQLQVGELNGPKESISLNLK